MVTRNGSGRLAAPVMDHEAVTAPQRTFNAQTLPLVLVLVSVLACGPTVP